VKVGLRRPSESVTQWCFSVSNLHCYDNHCHRSTSAECVLRAVAQEHQDSRRRQSHRLCKRPSRPETGGRAQVIIGMPCRATRGTYASPLISASLHDNNLAFSWEESKEESSEKDGARGCFGFASGKVCRRARRLRQLLRNLLLHINCCHMLEGGHMYPHTVLEPTDMHAVSMPED
jgi:hypothetical protein